MIFNSNRILRYPRFQAPTTQPLSNTLGLMFGLISAVLAGGAVLTIQTAGGHLSALPTAAWIMGKGAVASLAITPDVWRWDPRIQFPLYAAIAAGLTGGGLVWSACYQGGVIWKGGARIVTASQLFTGRGGIRLGKAQMSRRAETEHVLIQAGTGGGKTVPIKQIIGQVDDRRERALILDTKPEFIETARNFHGDGKGVKPGETRRTWLLALTDTRAAIWATGEDVRDEETAGAFTDSIMSSLDSSTVKGGDFWEEGAAVFVHTAVLMCIAGFGTKWSMGDFYTTVLELIDLPVPVQLLMVKKFYRLGVTVVSEKAPETLQGLMGQLKPALKPVDLIAKYETQKKGNPTYSIRRWMQSRDHLIVGANSAYKEAGQAFANSIIEQACLAILARPGNRSPNDSDAATWFILDELGDAGRCKQLTAALVKIRSKGGRIVAGIQGESQVAEHYGDKIAKTWMNNFTTKIFGRMASGAGAGDAKAGSDMIGHADLDVWQPPSGDNSWGRYQRLSPAPALVPPEEMKRLGLFTRGGKPAGVRLIGHNGDRTAEIVVPIKEYPIYRVAEVTKPLSVPAPISGRAAPVVTDTKKALEAAGVPSNA